jgi:hypothetical protein
MNAVHSKRRKDRRLDAAGRLFNRSNLCIIGLKEKLLLKYLLQIAIFLTANFVFASNHIKGFTMPCKIILWDNDGTITGSRDPNDKTSKAK